jgi:hypothetical protein
MAKRARLNRTNAENVAIRAQVDAFMAQGLPMDQAQAAAFKMFSSGEISASPTAKPAKSTSGLLRNLAKRAAKTAAAAKAADIQAGRRTKSGRKRTTKSKGRR